MPSQSAAFDPVSRAVQARVGVAAGWRAPDARTDEAVAKLLERPLDLDRVVRLAVARNPRLQARYEELGIAASELAAATVLPPAELDLAYKRAPSGGGSETELTIVQDLLALIQIGQRRGAAVADLEAARARAVADTVALAGRAEIALYDQIAALQDLELVKTSAEAAAASAELVERQRAAGNATDLAVARAQDQRERMQLELSRAEQQVADTRSRLGALLGLRPAQREWTTVASLPGIPNAPPSLDDLDGIAESSSLDAAALGAEADAAAARGRAATVRAFVPTLGAGIAVARRDGGDWEVGPAIRIGIPLFDQQQGPRARARAEERRARSTLAATRNELAADVQAVRARVQRAFAEAHKLADVIVPLRKRVLEETVLHYNAMDASPFELLVARRDMLDAERQLIDAQRRYWTAVAQATAMRRGGHVRVGEEQP